MRAPLSGSGSRPADGTSLPPVGFDPSRIGPRLAKLIHPTLGIKRGIIDMLEAGKGFDRDDKLIPVSVGEIREVHAVLSALAGAAFGRDSLLARCEAQARDPKGNAQ